MNIPKQTIVFVLPSFAAGGAERVMITILNALPDKYSKHLVAVINHGDLESYVGKDIKVENLNAKSVRNSLWRLLKFLRREKPDYIVSTMAHMNFAVLLLKPFLQRKTKIIVREAVQPTFFYSALHPVKAMLVKAAHLLLYPLADLVISPSQRMIDEFRDVLGMNVSRQKLLLNPVNTDLIRAKAASLPQQRINAIRFVCAGRLHPAKGFDRLIEQIHLLPQAMNWQLDIYGQGAEQEKLENLIDARGLQDKVFLRGFTDNPWAHMAAADMFLLPSRWEGLPNVVLESLALGVPVIAMAEAGGIQEIADRTGAAVKIATTIEDFITEMAATAKRDTTQLAPSLLPAAFELPQIMAEFEQILRQL